MLYQGTLSPAQKPGISPLFGGTTPNCQLQVDNSMSLFCRLSVLLAQVRGQKSPKSKRNTNDLEIPFFFFLQMVLYTTITVFCVFKHFKPSVA